MSELARQGSDGKFANEVEGYLLWQARIAEARQRAHEFVRPMEWLTTAQRTEIEQHYVTDNLRRAKSDLERVADRCRSLRAEYEHRYRTLRRRCVGSALAVCAAFTLLVTLWMLLF
ncbi:cytochrome C oxidase subunit I [Streptomyces sp. NPDC102462]|uniref:cytochrome C oxidase subunit I n=1 Tax=Streptomyces sp. NPDC102462 TaxID=3366178 RepID=UPI0037F54094